MKGRDRPPLPPATLPGRAAAVCHRCGGHKNGPLVPCKSCGHVPTGPERPVAWLFSSHHLTPEEMEEAARRIRAGEIPDPSRALLRHARRAMGAPDPEDEASRPLSGAQLLLLAAADVLLSPLVGLAAWWGWRDQRPVAARQALRITLPAAVGMAVLWSLVIGRRLVG